MAQLIHRSAADRFGRKKGNGSGCLSVVDLVIEMIESNLVVNTPRRHALRRPDRGRNVLSLELTDIDYDCKC